MKSQLHILSVNEGFEKLTKSHGVFGNMTTSPQQDMYELSRDLFEISNEIVVKLQKMRHKSNELIALEASMVAVQLASLAAMAGIKLFDLI